MMNLDRAPSPRFLDHRLAVYVAICRSFVSHLLVGEVIWLSEHLSLLVRYHCSPKANYNARLCLNSQLRNMRLDCSFV